MANEAHYDKASLTGATLYLVAWNQAGQAWNGSAFATYTTTRGTWDIAATEISGTGKWTAPVPTGAYDWSMFLQVGGSPSHADDISLKVWGIDRANDASGNTIAPASTALSTAVWNSTLVALIESLDTMTGILGLGIVSTIPSIIYDAKAASEAAYNNTVTLLARLTVLRAGYMDNLNAGSVLASQADIIALNQSASRRVILTTVQQYERPESSSTDFWIEARTYSRDGADMSATGTPTLTATGSITGSLAANLSSVTNPSTGLYRWVYNVESGDALEQIRFDFAGTVDGDALALAVFSQVCDFVATTFTTSDRQLLEDAKGAAEAAQAQTDLLDFSGAGGALKSESTNMRGTDDALLAASYAAPDNAGISALATAVADVPTNAEFAAKFPANFTALAINASGHVSRVTLVDTTTANTDMRGTNNALPASSYQAPPSVSDIAEASVFVQIDANVQLVMRGYGLGKLSSVTTSGHSPTTTAFKGTSLSSVAGSYVGQAVAFTEGANAGITTKITAHNVGTDVLTVSPALLSAPSNGDKFTIIGRLD